MPLIRWSIRAGVAGSFVLAALGIAPWTHAALGEPRKEEAPKSKDQRALSISEAQQYCANIAAAAGIARNARQEKRLAEIEQQIGQRLSELEAKRAELQELLDRHDAFVRKADEQIIAIYARMRPETAAAQLADMDEESAAALLFRLQPKYSSAILNEMETSRAVVLAKKISGMSTLARAGKKS